MKLVLVVYLDLSLLPSHLPYTIVYLQDGGTEGQLAKAHSEGCWAEAPFYDFLYIA
jgi:hypothetical protein